MRDYLITICQTPRRVAAAPEKGGRGWEGARFGTTIGVFCLGIVKHVCDKACRDRVDYGAGARGREEAGWRGMEKGTEFVTVSNAVKRAAAN